MSTVALPPFVSVPSAHVTVPDACEQLPCDGVAEPYATVLGRLSVSCTPVALRGPELATVSVYVSCWPASTGSGPSLLVSDRSAAGSTVVCAVAVRSAVSGSTTSDVMLAWLLSVPGPCGVTLIATVASASSAIVPRLQVTVPLDSMQGSPCDGVAKSNVTPPGSVSVSTTPVALCGPALCAVSV